MAVHGAVGQFNEEAEEWPAYCERLMHYFTANDVETAEKRRAILLSVCGAHIYQLVRSLVSPEKPVSRNRLSPVKIYPPGNVFRNFLSVLINYSGIVYPPSE